MAASRIRWAFDGTLFYTYTPADSIKNLVGASAYYILDGDIYVNPGVDVTAWYTSHLWNFPCSIKLEKIMYRISATPNAQGVWTVSNDSTDGFDGSWTTVNSDSMVGGTNQVFVFDPVVDARWLKGTYWYQFGRILSFMHIFGQYQSPLFEFWNNAADAELTADYPLSLANAPNDSDYAGSLNFKIKNTDSSTHSYSLTIVPVKYNADAIITDHFTLSTDGGSTKLSTVTVSSLGAGNFSGSIGIYGDVTKTHNPANGLHYFAVHVTVTA
jgi:hypothetical protein